MWRTPACFPKKRLYEKGFCRILSKIIKNNFIILPSYYSVNFSLKFKEFSKLLTEPRPNENFVPTCLLKKCFMSLWILRADFFYSNISVSLNWKQRQLVCYCFVFWVNFCHFDDNFQNSFFSIGCSADQKHGMMNSSWQIQQKD